MKPRKIMFVVTEDWYFFSHRIQLALAAQKLGHEVIVAARMTDHQRRIENLGIRTISLKRMRRSSLNIMNEMAALIELLVLIRREKPELLHLVAIKPVIYGSIVSRVMGGSCRVNALGGLGFTFSSKRLVAKLLRPIISILFRFIFNDSNGRLILQNANDKRVLTDIVGIDQRQVRLIPGSGVDIKEYRANKLPRGTPIVMLASRMLWDKGVGEFVEAAASLKKQGICARFVLVGDPDEENPSTIHREQLQEWNDAGNIEWWGHKENMPQVLSKASVVCLPTYYGEGVPKVLIEAMACARPIVTTRTPGCRELVISERNGLLVQPRDAASLAMAVFRLLNDPLRLEKMGYEGRLLAERAYSLPKVIKEILDVYRELFD